VFMPADVRGNTHGHSGGHSQAKKDHKD